MHEQCGQKNSCGRRVNAVFIPETSLETGRCDWRFDTSRFHMDPHQKWLWRKWRKKPFGVSGSAQVQVHSKSPKYKSRDRVRHWSWSLWGRSAVVSVLLNRITP